MRTYFSKDEKITLRKIHYDRLFNFLDIIKHKTKKKVIFCQHPKVNYNNESIKLQKRNYIFSKGKTEKYISSADIVIFTGGSSLVNLAILYKKKILFTLEKNENYPRQLISSLTDQISLKVIFLKDIYNFNYKKLNSELNKKLKFYDKFINNHLVYKKNIRSHSQIKLFLKSH